MKTLKNTLNEKFRRHSIPDTHGLDLNYDLSSDYVKEIKIKNYKCLQIIDKNLCVDLAHDIIYGHDESLINKLKKLNIDGKQLNVNKYDFISILDNESGYVDILGKFDASKKEGLVYSDSEIFYGDGSFFTFNSQKYVGLYFDEYYVEELKRETKIFEPLL